jgi:hypothetical protein
VNEHDARLLGPKAKAVSDADCLAAFAGSHAYCQACGADYRPLQVHHMIGGRGGRSDEACNLLRLCGHPCHLLAEGLNVSNPANSVSAPCEVRPRLLPKLTLAIQLSIKRLRDPAEFNEMRLTVLHGRRLPDHEPIPMFFTNLFWQNRPELRHAPDC